MNKAVFALIALLAFTGVANAIACGTNATDNGSGTCLCNQGYYGDTTAAAVGGTCTKCDGSATTDTPGLNTNTKSGLDKGVCNRCPANQYMTAAAGTNLAATCSACPPNSQSAIQTAPGFCICYDTNAAVLSQTVSTCGCKIGTYGTVATTSGAATGCQTCPAGSTTSASGKTAVTDCACNSTNSVAIAASTDTCKCAANYYGDATISGGCVACPTGSAASTPGQTAITGCTCADAKAATLAAGDTTCKCRAGTYGTGVTSGSCSDCTSNTWSTAGATAAAGCNSCAANYYQSSASGAPLTCGACPTDSKSAAGSKTDISACTCNDTNANTLSSSANTCTCKTGYTGSASAASPCKANSTNAVVLSIFGALLSLVVLI
ncbi:immobilization antigen (macronuclear) [Tetrahymena thermophila SB210]|uniref:Immobilization antigen n=1 Tax=Tetrahymena thermophila (strain SB210) TaxID=312017 RepID=Q241Q4_TETTS|nr:immobilization antigen [Tetrahymena thermophila SB210]EAS02516.1 immobilization antigen [Tetrahymena thermophila SB210]|eukprot:XP_001022761.1 immobilization antigen [Tetrahymena thermophila SB210]